MEGGSHTLGSHTFEELRRISQRRRHIVGWGNLVGGAGQKSKGEKGERGSMEFLLEIHRNKERTKQKQKKKKTVWYNQCVSQASSPGAFSFFHIDSF